MFARDNVVISHFSQFKIPIWPLCYPSVLLCNILVKPKMDILYGKIIDLDGIMSSYTLEELNLEVDLQEIVIKAKAI